MVRSDKAGSGVMFSIDTETGFPNAIVINAAWGLGEFVVKGVTDPDEYVVFKPLLGMPRLTPILEKRLGAKRQKLVYARSANRPTRAQATSKQERRSFVLQDREILKLAEWARAIEDHYGHPMDIEWAKDGITGKLFIVQARPETVQSRRVVGAFKTYRLKETKKALVTGLAIGSSIAAGAVCRLNSAREADRFPDGAILVAEMTDPDWGPIMKRASAIVTAHGGRTSHAAIVSREMGLPAIVGAEGATHILKNGEVVTVSCAEGDKGFVYPGRLKFDEEVLSPDAIPKTRTHIMLNIGDPAGALRWWRLPTDGIGLARMEFIVSNHVRIHPMALVRFREGDARAAHRVQFTEAIERVRGQIKEKNWKRAAIVPGKTVLLNFLCAQAQKFHGRIFFFDKDRGAEIFLRAIGGSYSILGGGQPSGFNPLQLPDTPENRTFLSEWLQSLVTTLNEPFTSQDMERVAQAVNGNYRLSPEDRTLAKIAPFLGMPGPGTLAGRLAMWHSDGALKNLFGSERDVLNLSNGIAGFEMGPILQSREALAPVLLYLFHRIRLVLDGTPTMIVLDEAWALLDNPVFAPKIKDWLKTLRKLNALVVFATQSVEDAAKSRISDTLVQQSATQIYLPNSKATDAYRTDFKLSERELQVVRTLDPASRSFLIKQGRDAVVAKLDLSDLKDVISVLSGRAESVARLDGIRAQAGDDPSAWLPIYLEDQNEKHIRAA